MSDPTASAPDAAPDENPQVAPANPYAAQPNPYVAPAYQPVPTVPGPAAPPPYVAGGVAYVTARRTNPLAIVSLVLSLSSLLFSITAIGGVITGHIALAQIKRTGDDGRGLAIAGVIVGYAMIAVLALSLVFFFAMFGLLFATVEGSTSFS
ncbi:DUF4190 domain-containing protein [Homoserinibacter sp. GY 40078]|uniref:DUF4190 domain-containing protein n=1 Tax=Homoserinibacter sp. GY 40078 TaxID=2603275 RepID=UPI0011C7E285|nr:DUF4190 domain-containing protein [Homoserinibacter sp. GY 40078]TXK19209.1 DUF4190 domain-containing protein [Homoserinibacter sp. GY 40078]